MLGIGLDVMQVKSVLVYIMFVSHTQFLYGWRDLQTTAHIVLCSDKENDHVSLIPCRYQLNYGL